MDSHNTLMVPPPDEIAARITAAQEEVKALKKLYSLAKNLERANELRRVRESRREVPAGTGV